MFLIEFFRYLLHPHLFTKELFFHWLICKSHCLHLPYWPLYPLLLLCSKMKREQIDKSVSYPVIEPTLVITLGFLLIYQ